MKRSVLIGPLAAAVLAWHPAAAQTVRGEVVEAAGTAVAGARVVLLDASGQRVAASVSGPSGDFRLTAPAAGSYVLRVERIGFATTSARVELRAGEVVDQRVVSGSRPVTLAGVSAVGAGSRCEVRPDSGRITATLWEEARKALDLANSTEAEQLYRYRVRTVTRDLGGPGMLVRSEQAADLTGASVQPFVSAPLPRLAEGGFIQPFADSVAYYAPDARVLLSGDFMNTHCFRVTAATDSPSVIGLAFEPVRGRYAPDVKGVLWLNRETAELRWMDYEYTNAPLRGPRGVPGGRVEFKRLPNAAWIVSRWQVRMPYQEIQTSRDPQHPAPPPALAIREKVAEVVNVLTRSGRLVDMEPPAYATLEGVVFDSTRARPLAGARVFISGTAHEAVTDSTGRFRIANLREGTYTLSYTAPRLDTLGYVPMPQPVTLAARAVERRELGIPAAAGARPPAAGTLAAAEQPQGAVGLPAVRAVAGRNRTLEAAGFYRRRQQGRGIFMTDSAFNRNTPIESVLRRITGVRVIRYIPPGRNGRVDVAGSHPETRVVSGRTGPTSLSLHEGEDPADRYCYVPIYVDGVQVVRGSNEQGNDIGQVSMEHVVAIEVYRSGTEVPVEFGGVANGCGLIAVWTEDGPRGARATAAHKP